LEYRTTVRMTLKILTKGDKATILIVTLLSITILITLKVGKMTYNDIFITNFTYKWIYF
jgi:hypothetical protein